MYVRRDGTILWFKNSKAKKNHTALGRTHAVKWTRHYVKGGIK